MKERIIEFLKSENKSSAQLAEEIGVQPSGISHILSGRNKPSLDFILKMLEKYTFLSTEWLLFGKGKMYRDQPLQDLFAESLKSESSSELSEKTEKQQVNGPEVVIEKGDNELKIKSQVEKIVLFYKDKTFTEYLPGAESGKKS